MDVIIKYWQYQRVYIEVSIAILFIATFFISGCDTSQQSAVIDNSNSALSLIITADVPNYSVVDEVINYTYQLTNSGNVSLAGPAVISNSGMDASCPSLESVGNNDAVLQPGETITCSSLHVVTQTDLDADAIDNQAVAFVSGVRSNEGVLKIGSIAESLFIFPFDTKDPAVIFRSSLTSAGSIIQAGGTEESGSINEFDSVLGMKPAAIPNGVPGCRFTEAVIAELASLPDGQLSIEVERKWLAITNPEIDSTGYDRTSIEYLISYGVAGTSTLGRLYMQPDGYLLSHFTPQEGTRRARLVNTSQSTRFARITISWTPDVAELYIDGLLVGTIGRTNKAVTKFSSVYIGTLGGSSVNSIKNNFYIRNLIISKKPVISKTQPLLRHIMQMGDSFSSGLPLFNVPEKYDGTISNTIVRELFMNGFSYKKYTVYSNGGGKIQDQSNDPLEIDVNGSGKTRAEALAENPSLIIFITGGNDLGILQTDLFRIDLHDHIEAFLGVNGHLLTNVQYVIVLTTTSKLNAKTPALLTMRDIMLALPEWWDIKYPGLSGKVHVIDTWQIFGGSSVNQLLFGVIDPIHPSASGNIVYGRAIADRIMLLAR